MDFVERLAVAGLFFLGQGRGPGAGRPLFKLCREQGMIRGDLLEHAEAQRSHGVDTYPLAGSNGAQEPENLFPGMGHVGPGDVRLVDQQDGCAAVCGRCGRGVRGAVGEGAIRCRPRSRDRGGAGKLSEEAEVLLAAIVVNLKIVGLEVLHRMALLVPGHNAHVYESRGELELEVRRLRLGCVAGLIGDSVGRCDADFGEGRFSRRGGRGICGLGRRRRSGRRTLRRSGGGSGGAWRCRLRKRGIRGWGGDARGCWIGGRRRACLRRVAQHPDAGAQAMVVSEGRLVHQQGWWVLGMAAESGVLLGESQAARGKHVAVVADRHRAILHNSAGPGDGVGALEFSFNRDAEDCPRVGIDGQGAVVTGGDLEMLRVGWRGGHRGGYIPGLVSIAQFAALAGCILAQAAVADLKVRNGPGHGIVVNRGQPG